jgi:dipeptidyl-peptidase-3
LRRFLVYAATILSNVGNYFGSGDQKFLPDLDDDVFRKLAGLTPKLTELYKEISIPIRARPPFSLGYPSDTAQSAYYLRNTTEQEITMVSRVLEQNAIFPENTRIRKAANNLDFDVLVASTQNGGTLRTFPLPDGKGSIRLVQGDHSAELEQTSTELAEAIE